MSSLEAPTSPNLSSKEHNPNPLSIRPLTTEINMGNHQHATPAADTQTVTRAFGMRVVRTVRRGQLPFLLVFFSCVIIFFTALSGIGYVEPASSNITPIGELSELGSPLGGWASGPKLEEERLAEMKKLEDEWARAKRPKDGAWMKSQRDQREIRRKPLADSRFQRAKQQEDIGGRAEEVEQAEQ